MVVFVAFRCVIFDPPSRSLLHINCAKTFSLPRTAYTNDIREFKCPRIKSGHSKTFTTFFFFSPS